MTKKISELAAVTTPMAGTETLEVVQSGVNKKATAAQLFGTTGAGTALGLGTAAYKNTGVSGNVVALLDAANVWSGANTFPGFTIGLAATINLPNTGVATDSLFFTSANANTGCNLQVRPNGTSQASGFIAYNGSDVTNASRMQFFMNASALNFASNQTGTGLYLPMYFNVGSGGTKVAIETNGLVQPGADGTQDFGATGRKWNNIHAVKLNVADVAATGVVILGGFTMATLPSAAANTRGQIWISNLASGAEPCWSNGTNWCKYSDKSVAS